MKFDEYSQRFTRAKLRKDGGVVEVTFHDGNGGSLVWDEPAHRELPQLYQTLANDTEIRVIILTGAGDVWCTSGDGSGWPPKWTAEAFQTLFYEGRKLLENHLSIEVPMIAAINGPATWHAEQALLCDMVLAAEDVVLKDEPHFPYSPPSDGVHTVWPALLGPNRARWFLLSKQEIDASEAQRLGLVGQVLKKDEVLPRAWELARHIDAQDPLIMRYTRLALTHQLKRQILDELPYGMSLIGLSILR
jgi:enoyl-CoA hydratase/carnithine racemase